MLIFHFKLKNLGRKCHDNQSWVYYLPRRMSPTRVHLAQSGYKESCMPSGARGLLTQVSINNIEDNPPQFHVFHHAYC